MRVQGVGRGHTSTSTQRRQLVTTVLTVTATVMALSSCGSSASDDLVVAATDDPPAAAQEDAQSGRYVQPVIKNRSTDTVWVSFEGAMDQNVELKPGLNITGRTGDDPWPSSFRITKDGGAQILFASITTSNIGVEVDYSPNENEASCLNAPGYEPINQGVCEGRSFTVEFSSGIPVQTMTLTLTGDNWK